MENEKKRNPIRIVISIGSFGATEHFCGDECPLKINDCCMIDGQKLEMDNNAIKNLRTDNCKFMEINN